MSATKTLSEQIVERTTLQSGGLSGSTIERVRLMDGRELILKRVSPEWDWLSRATGDTGRLPSMWESGLLGRVPDVVDHATVAVERDGVGWNVFMRDVSEALLPAGARLDEASVRRVLETIAKVHDTFWGGSFPDLCGLADRYLLLSPQTAERERAHDNPIAHHIERGWQVFADSTPREVADPVFAILERPGLLAEQLDRCEKTLIHGDLRIANLGFAGDSVVLIDWGERTGAAPPAVEIAWFLAFDASHLQMSREDFLDMFRAISADRFEEKALKLALIGALVQKGCSIARPIVDGNEERHRTAARADLNWWITAARSALEVWSPI